MVHLLPLALLLGSLVVLTACDPSARMTYDNQTGQRLCVYPGYQGADPDFCDAVEPNEHQTYEHICTGDEPVWNVITAGQGGAEIYRRVATCEEWDDATVTIQQRGDEFVVTDDLPDRTPRP